jgi:hypothetical protein
MKPPSIEVRPNQSVSTLESRAASIPDALAVDSQSSVAGALAPLNLEAVRSWLVTGIGASEGPARFLVSLLARQGISARYVPASAFLEAHLPTGDGLIVVSQRLSPNARLAIQRRSAYRACVILTSADPERDPHLRAITDEHVAIVRHAPQEEDGLLLRVVGPALACRTSLTIAATFSERIVGLRPDWSHALRCLSHATRQAWESPIPLEPLHALERSALVTFGEDAELAPFLRTKLLEGLGIDAPAWDVLGLVHGPLQSFFDEPKVLFVLKPANSAYVEGLIERLRAVVDAERHIVVVVSATLSSPLSLFEYASTFDRLVVARLRNQPRDLSAWPGQGRDHPLYDLDSAP